jgi:lipopolysaccharide transport system permease protein
MVKRDVIGRYKGSVFGVAWSFFNPIFMLVIYTFVFSIVFKAKWAGAASASKTEFSLILFTGMIVFGLFSEAINRAPSLVISNVNYVKKVVFPLEMLPIISMGSVLFHSFVSLLILLVAFILVNGYLPWTAIYIPVVFAPLIILSLGISWFLASLGVFMRDVGQTVGLLTTVLMFVSPIFYPLSSLPQEFQGWIALSPVSFIIEQARAILIFGLSPDWQGLALYAIVALLFMWLGFAWFQKTRKGFADVL